jgi:hypothetical protein
MNTNCKKCDRAQCPTLFEVFLRMPTAASNRALADCANHAVDWYSRAQAAEARATAAEAELAKLRDGLPRWHEWRDGDYSLILANKASIGGVTSKDDRWRCAPTGTNITRHDTRDDAMRAVEKALGLPVCEVLP